jgi:hypothetical protein
VLSEYNIRHNKVAGYIHWTVCKHRGFQITDRYYEHTPESVINDNGTTIMWDILVITDRKILTHLPNVLQHDKKEKTCLLIDMAIAGDSNIYTQKKKLKN